MTSQNKSTQSRSVRIRNFLRVQARFFATVALVLLASALTYVIASLFYKPTFRTEDGNTYNDDQLCQLRFLRDDLVNNRAAERMQDFYPEGYVFYNALYGLSWCDFADGLRKNSILYQEAHVEIQRAFNKLTSENGKDIFDKALPLPYGAFYTGWSMYLLSRKIMLEPPASRDPNEVNMFRERCNEIAAALQQTIYPSTYYGDSWPADVTICVATLANHDRLFDAKYRQVIDDWTATVATHLDRNGLIPFSAHPTTGEPLEAGRGSSTALMLVFLQEIDPSFAATQRPVFERLFLDTRFGLYGIREYPGNSDGEENIDSGPILLDMGGAASITGMRALYAAGSTSHAVAIRNAIEAVGFGQKADGRKKYLLGKHPMASVFIAWSGGVIVDDGVPDFGWRTRFVFFAVIAIAASVQAVWWMWKKEVRQFQRKLRAKFRTAR